MFIIIVFSLGSDRPSGIRFFPCSHFSSWPLLIIIIKKGWGESDEHPISPKTLAPQYQPIEWKKRKENH